MEEPEKMGTSESTVNEKVGAETLEGSVDYGFEIQMEGSFSEDVACNGKDIMVEVLGSEVYIDGVCTRGSDAEPNHEVGFGGSGDSPGLVSGAETRFEDSQALGSEEAKNDSEVVVGSSEIEFESLSDSRGQKEVPHPASSCEIEVPFAADDGVPDDMVTNALDCSVTVGGENVQSRGAEKDGQQGRNLTELEATEYGNDVTLKTWDGQDDKIVDQEASNCNKHGFEERLNVDKIYDNSTSIPEVVGGDLALDDLCPTEEMEQNKSVSDAEQCNRDKWMEMEVEDQQDTENTKIKKHTVESKCTSVDANAVSVIVEKDTEIANQRYASMGAGKEVLCDEANIRPKDGLQSGISGSEQVGSNGGQEIEVEEFNEAEQRKTTDGKVIKRAFVKPGSLGIFHQAKYLLPAEKEGEFSVSDMVWGKVRSHPWWPGQIFDPSDASEKAMKHYKKDCYLVAYFGDRTFAWNEASQLKPFRTHFSSIIKQSTSESFQNAVDCALDEVTRRAEFGLACSCIPKDTYDTIKFQTVENAGIRQEISGRYGVDDSLSASSFSPDKLLEYLKTLSGLPTGGFDPLELGIAKAQLLAFYRFKGYSCLPELQYCGGFDDDMDTLIDDSDKILSDVPVSKNDGQTGHRNLKGQNSSRKKRKHNLKDSMHQAKKQKSLSELMSGTPDSPDDDYWSEDKVIDNTVLPARSKKRRNTDHDADDSGMQDGRKTISLAKVSNTTRPSFKIGECIRRVASQLTGSPSLLKSSSDRYQKTDRNTDGFPANGCDVSFPNFEEAQRSSEVDPTEYSSLDDLLSSLQRVAQEPLGDYSFLNAIVSFFSDFRNSIVVADDCEKEILRTDKVGSKRKKAAVAGSPQTFEFEDMSDTYWTDRVIDNNGSEEQSSRRNKKRDYPHVPSEPGKPVQVGRRSNSKKRYSESNHAEEAMEKPAGYIDENSPAELVLNFAELDSVPSETSLNKMFRRFGPLKESETEVDRVSSRARVVFKKCADAEVACSSAKKFNIFGPILVNYELNYTPSALFKASSVATTQDQEMHLDLSNFEVNMYGSADNDANA